MATRRCLRCCKLVPETAAFCRRCGLALRANAGRGDADAGPAVPGFGPPPVPQISCRGGRGSGWGVLTSFLAVAAGLALLATSNPNPRRHLFCHETSGTADGATLFSHKTPQSWSEEAFDGPQIDGDALAAARRQIAAATERLAAARQNVEDARQRFETRTRVATEPQRPDPWAVESPTPWLTDISTASARRGATVTIRGRGFANTLRVVFAAGPDPVARAIRADAEFDARGGDTLVVKVPDLGRRRREVTILVITSDGAAVTAPATHGGPSFHVVPPGTRLTPESGETLFVERDATVASPTGSLLLVRAGGTVDRALRDCLIVRETPNPLEWDLSETPVIDVRALNACVVDSLFQYAGR